VIPLDLIPPPSGEAWPWLAGVLVFAGVPAVGWLVNKLYDLLITRGDEYKARSDACYADLSKTTDALHVANDATERLAKQSSDADARIETMLDRIFERLLASSEGSPRRGRS
jgi:hypothetical protein